MLRRGQARARSWRGDAAPARAPSPVREDSHAEPARRNILFITSDQQRFDSLAVNGGCVARTPTLDALAESGINYQRAHVQNVVCMPSRATMMTGQHPLTHGVFGNGVPLPEHAPTAVGLLRDAGYGTALIGKAHFEPHLDLTLRYQENRLAAEGSTGPWRGFDHVELATHGPVGGHHYANWLWEHQPEAIAGFGGVLSGEGGGDTGAPEVARNPVAREHYHTDWIADRTIAWLREAGHGAPWFCWMSFPDPHHPFDPPHDEVRARLDWRDLDLPVGRPRSRGDMERFLSNKPQHWRDYFEGAFRNPEGGPVDFVAGKITDDQVREINAMIHVENELIDEACGRVLTWLREHDLDSTTDIFFTSDHGELQGDHGLMFKGPYHVDALLRVPLIWRPAPAAEVTGGQRLDMPVGIVDLAPTFCSIAGIEVPQWMQGQPLPLDASADRQRVLTTFDSQFANVGMHLRTMYRDGWLCTVYQTSCPPLGGHFPLLWAMWGRNSRLPNYSGSEGELYNVHEDPHQWHNLWHDPQRRALRDELVADLLESLPPLREPQLTVVSPT